MSVSVKMGGGKVHFLPYLGPCKCPCLTGVSLQRFHVLSEYRSLIFSSVFWRDGPILQIQGSLGSSWLALFQEEDVYATSNDL